MRVTGAVGDGEQVVMGGPGDRGGRRWGALVGNETCGQGDEEILVVR